MNVKDNMPIETAPAVVQNTYMADAPLTDPFLIRLRARIDSDPNLTVSGLAVEAGLDNSAIRAMFRRGNQSPKLDTARRICKALGTTLEEFMSDAETPEEREIVRLVMQLPEDARRQLLGYGQALLDAQDRGRNKSSSDDE